MKLPTAIVPSLILVALGTFVGLWIADIARNGFEFKEWQTLAAGALAILAAVHTVRAMHWSDERQQERHEELVRLSLRYDALVAERAADRAEFLRDTSTYCPDIPKFPGGIDDMHQGQLFADAAEKWLAEVSREAEHAVIKDALRLFDGSMRSSYDFLHLCIADARGALAELRAELPRVGEGRTAGRATWLDYQLTNVFDGLTGMADSLDRLGRTYE